MNAVQAVRSYVDKMVQGCGPGMKILLMDKETTAVVSMVYSQSEIMEKEVYLCDRIDKLHREPLRHLKCMTLLRPSQENIHLLASELKVPLYGSYFLYWTNVISKADVKRLAEADEQELVREISEIFADFVPVSPHLFTSSIPIYPVFTDGEVLPESTVQSMATVLISFLLAVKKYPVIRYTEGSSPTQKLADKIHNLMIKESNLFDFQGRSASRPVLLILDRRDDCVTPLLNQWTYQAMVHELLTIRNHRVSLADAPDIHPDFKEVVLSGDSDQFFEENMYADFGSVGQSLRQLVESYQTNLKSQQKVESIEDMKNFVENYPQFKKISGQVSKHVAVVGELARLNEKYSLLEVSELEQEIACHSNHSSTLQRLKQAVDNGKIRDQDALRLVLLYALKYENHSNNDIVGLVTKLRNRGLGSDKLGLVQSLLKFGGAKKRRSDLFGSDPVAVTKRFIKGLQGVENIYTQHTPWVKGVVEDLLRGKLKESAYPHFSAHRTTAMSGELAKPGEVLVFIIGGVTYAESLAIHSINKAENRLVTVIGGTTVHNMNSFLEEVTAYTARSKSKVAAI